MEVLEYILNRLEILQNNNVVRFFGVHSSAQPFVCCALSRKFPDFNILIVVDDLRHQETFHNDLTTLLKLFNTNTSGDNSEFREPLFYAEWDVFPDDGKLPHVDALSDRLETLINLLPANYEREGLPEVSSAEQHTRKSNKIVVASAVSLIQKTLSPAILQQLTLQIKIGDRIDPYKLIDHLNRCAYEREAKVTQKGEYSHRGGIIDIFPLTSPLPIRIEFFGDEIDSIRVFDPVSQISQESVSSLVIPPAGEYAILRDALVNNAKSGQDFTEETLNFSISGSTLLDYLGSNTFVIFCEPDDLKTKADSYLSRLKSEESLYIHWDKFIDSINEESMKILEFYENPSDEGRVFENNISQSPDLQNSKKIKTKQLLIDSLDAYRPLSEAGLEYQIADINRRIFFEQIQKWLEDNYKIILICPNESQFKRVKEVWREYGLNVKWINPGKQENHKIQFFQGSLTRGFIFNEAKFIIITDAEIFGRLRYLRPRRLKSKYLAGSIPQSIDLTDIEEGDYVVHLNYGIGRFLGLEKIKPSNRTGKDGDEGQECLVIEYAPTRKGKEPPKLYVPVSESHLVTKYIGSGKGHPPLNTLSGKKWQKAKENALNAIKDLAAELLSLQAERISTPGFAFAPDSTWQHDFENSFEFEETPDQIQAILDTKSDMESPKPMDRLICGDAGYGKTEVALRAAFKAVMSGKQVAILVPTTVLAQQHYNTFRARMAPYPINIGLLSRFKTKGKQSEIVKEIAQGKIDIVIGTHRLLQDDVVFHDLGLVIIDEEQRFGVIHKEKLKLIKRKVDVLTLTATPIPRTLYLALMGARDMSIIQTPPHDRLPVETIVAKYDENLIRDAILKEINRGGQVFYLHNQVFDIEQVAEKLKSIVPEARIVVGHGRMSSKELEDAMSRFVNGEADVLLSTTIVENGLDIPNANTIIIDRADRFGLSDLYQLRGRVGRYKHQAYAYLLLPRHTELLANARKRISAIKQFSSLGSGFKVAMRDLEIRGAGNILGVEQSGHIAAIGFHLYCQLLEQEIKKLKGEQLKILPTVSVYLDFIATNPAEETAQQPVRSKRNPKKDELNIFVPREVAYYINSNENCSPREDGVNIVRAPAYIPSNYIEDYGLRTEIYRKIARATSCQEVINIEKELTDRFGKPPEAVKLFLTIAEIKILAGEKGITRVETKGDKLMLLRNNDYIMLNGKFPRLIKQKPDAKLKEIKMLLKQL